jgi:hypothetical protein
VGRQAVEDGGYGRAAMFPPLWMDPGAVVDVKFMHGQMPIDRRSGVFMDTATNRRTQFDNEKHGLLMMQQPKRGGAGGGARATYLPGVFPGMSWVEITARLMNKAGVGRMKDDPTIEFYAYNTQRSAVQVGRIYNLMFDPLVHFMNRHVPPPQRLTSTSTTVNFPLFIGSDGSVHRDDTEAVRNVATIQDLKRLHGLGLVSAGLRLDPDCVRALDRDLQFYTKKYEENPDQHTQMSAFLIMHSPENRSTPTICRHLAKKLLTGTLEEQFELGEVLLSLTNSCADATHNRRGDDSVFTMLLDRAAMLRDPESVFELNWHVQFLVALWRKMKGRDSETAATEKNVQKLKEMLSKYWQRLQRMFASISGGKSLSKAPTNIIVVTFEAMTALSSVFAAVRHRRRQNNDDKTDVKIPVVDPAEEWSLFHEIWKRWNFKNGTLMFLDGSSRLDFTGHTINALGHWVRP